jgi:hypothetical protein
MVTIAGLLLMVAATGATSIQQHEVWLAAGGGLVARLSPLEAR